MKLSGKNFQAWADFDIEIEGLTILTGPSDVGKSATFRALKGVMRNELPTEFVRNGQDEDMEVCVEVNGHKVCARRARKGSTKYVVDGNDYAKLAGAVPDSLKALNFGEVVLGDFDVDPIFGRQNSAQFLIDPLTYKPAEINAILGAFGGTEKLEAGKKEANLRKTQKDAEGRTIASQMREAEERKAALEEMAVKAHALEEELVVQDVTLLEMDIEWLDKVVACRQHLVPLRQIADALVLPDAAGLDALFRLATYADQASEASAFARWLQKPQNALSNVSVGWVEVRDAWNLIVALDSAVAAGKHVVSTDNLKTSLSGAEGFYSEVVRLWNSINRLEGLALLLGEITDSAESLAVVEIELSATQAEIKKGMCPRCGKPMEHACI